MRQFFPFAILFCLIQPALGQNFRLGVFLDPSISWLKPDVPGIQYEKSRLGLDIGLSTDYYFAGNYAVASGISLFTTGGTLKYTNGITLHVKGNDENTVPPGEKVQYKIQYLKIPAALKLRTHQIGRFVYSANLGLDPMIRLIARGNYLTCENITISKEIKPLALAYHIGGHVEYSLGRDVALMFGIKYMNIFTDVTSPNDRITVNSIMLKVGVSF